MPMTLLRTALLPLSWVALFANMTWLRYMRPFGRSAEHPGYGENHPGDLPMAYAISATEVAILLAITRPWSRDPIWRRALAALLLFGPWTVVWIAAGMHAGSIESAHVLWRLAITLGLIVTVLVSMIRHAYYRVTAA